MGVQRVIEQFKRMPEMEQTNKMVNQESYTRQRITKVSELLKKQQKENRELEITELMYQILMYQCLTGKGLKTVNLHDLHDLGWILDHKLKEIKKRYESLRKAAHDQQQQQLVPQPPPSTTTTQPQQMMQQMRLNHGMLTRDLLMNGGQVAQNFGLDLGIARGFEHEPPPSIPCLGLGMDVMQRPPHDWLAEWVNKPHDLIGFWHGHGNGNGNGNGGQSHGGQMMMAFNNN